MITNTKSCEVAVYFNSISHSLQYFSFQCLDQINETNRRDGIEKLLVTKELYWSAQLFTLAPHGLNKRHRISFKKGYILTLHNSRMHALRWRNQFFKYCNRSCYDCFALFVSSGFAPVRDFSSTVLFFVFA